MSRHTNEEIINAYKETGSVWRAGKKLGLAGQTVHEKLVNLGYKLSSAEWTDEEIKELKSLVNELTIAQIANRLGRPYNGVAIKISRLGIGDRYGNKQKKKPIPRNGLYKKEKIAEYLKELEAEDLKLSTIANRYGLNRENLSHAIQRHFPDKFADYAKKHGPGHQKTCSYCETLFWPLSHKQKYCTRQCSDEARTDRNYFGGNRRNTIGLADKTCQLCGNKTEKGLSSHHMIGKENDPENKYLIALCQGCHQIVTIVAGRRFAATPEAWEVLIQLVLIRKHGDKPDMRGVFCSVDIEFVNDENAHLYEEL